MTLRTIIFLIFVGAIAWPQTYISPSSELKAMDCRSFKEVGQDSVGSYTGHVIVINKEKVYRTVTYRNLWKNKFQIQSLWSGQIIYSSADILMAKFLIQGHHFLSEVNSVVLDKSEFQRQDEVFLNLNNTKSFIKEPSCQFSIKEWNDSREKILIKKSEQTPLLVKLSKSLIIDPIMKWYEKQSILDPYRNEKDFIEKNFYKINDFTDYSFYQNILNRNILRLRNTEVNSFTLTEAELRQSAYSYSIDEKAKIFDEATYKNNINSLGLFYIRTGVEHIADRDSALWTGMYTVSQISRYLVTKNDEALTRAKTSLRGLLLLLNVSENKKEFARSAMPNDGSFKASDKWKLDNDKFNNLYWLPGGNNDMIKGIIIAFAWAHKVLDEKDPLFMDISRAVKNLKKVKLARLGNLNQTYLFALDALYNNSDDSYKNYVRYYLANQNLLDLIGLDHQFYIDGVADWSGLNLSMVGILSLYVLSDELEKKNFNNDSLLSEDFGNYQIGNTDARWIKKQQLKTIRELNETAKYLKRDFLCLMNSSMNYEKTGPAPKECFYSLAETPAYIPEESLGFDYRLKKYFIFSSAPDLPWKSFPKKQKPEKHLLPNVFYPKFEGEAFTSQMMWKEGFQYMDKKLAKKQIPRVDYLFSYWTYRYFTSSSIPKL